MHAGRKYKVFEVFLWTRRELLAITLTSTFPVVLFAVFGMTWLTIPWLPMALVGTAVAFVVGFKNNASYDRLWEGRQIWGGIVNTSRTWGIMAKDFVTNKYAAVPLSDDDLHAIHTRLVYRHIAWLTALRFQLRQPRAWENLNKVYNLEYRQAYSIPEHENKLEDELAKVLSKEDLAYLSGKANGAAQLISLQSQDLNLLNTKGYLDDFRHMEMQNLLKDLYEHQGKCERIKNFPYPRQFATLNLYFIKIFIILLPFGMMAEFEKLGEHFVWFSIPFSTLVGWIFHTMEKIGEATENPFEGTANDVPMTALSRTIEIDLREMLNETNLPPKIEPVNNILM